MNNNRWINVTYFCFLFVVLATLHAFHVLALNGNQSFDRTTFLTLSLLQCSIEIGAIVLLITILPRFATSIIIGAVALITLFRLVDLPLERLTDMSIWYAFDFAFDETFANFIELLKASNISIFTWLIGGGIGLFIWLIFFCLFFFGKRKTTIQSWRFPAVYGAVVLFLGALDFTAAGSLPPASYEQFRKTLPWKTTLFTPPPIEISLPGKLNPPPDEHLFLGKVSSCPVELIDKPNIFLFVIESLRADCITPEISPNLYRFAQENLSIPISLSNANATHNSWFSLFYSQWPFYWNVLQPPKWVSGSPALKLFKRLGYQIHAYTASEMNYYHMDQVIFGKSRYLADSFNAFVHEGAEHACDCDRLVIDKLCTDIAERGTARGHLYIIFLDSTHFEYSFPKNPPPKFVPVTDKINYMNLVWDPNDMEVVKNRYCNAIHYIDGLFGHFQEKLKQIPGSEKDFIVVTSDHGEEFRDTGYLFHASDLSRSQTKIPILYKVCTNRPCTAELTSQVDIFPTLLHCATGQEEFCSLMQGESIFQQNRWPYVVAARYNAGRSPSDFFIHRANSKLVLRFNHGKEIFKADKLFILSQRDPWDHFLPIDEQKIHQEYQAAFEKIFPAAAR